jgi:hypothetical protein
MTPRHRNKGGQPRIYGARPATNDHYRAQRHPPRRLSVSIDSVSPVSANRAVQSGQASGVCEAKPRPQSFAGSIWVLRGSGATSGVAEPDRRAAAWLSELATVRR